MESESEGCVPNTFSTHATLSHPENVFSGCTTYTGDASAIARRAQAAHGTFPERGPGTNSLPYMVRNAGRCSEGNDDVIGSQ
ncbi:hypothetical protein EVAR_43254_1 [Eumeta japonica]|uniref:Uncharacterized protein n=1 Tax=Eumeta variegata TaxID=151549 RepID=A0A4C1WVG1_EUMVA|nr:hypothetical protein EVAR_43254_1 [Eumeta japonica]